MKKYVSLLLVALMLLIFLVSCSTSQNGNDVNSSGSSMTQDSTNQGNATIDSSTQNSSNGGVTQGGTNQSNTTVDSSKAESTQLPDVPPTDSSTTNSSQKPNACEHMWVQNDADQCEHLEVCVLCGDERGEDILHIYFDENGNCLEKCLNCGKQNSQYTPTEQTYTVTWKLDYTYKSVYDSITGEPLAQLLVNNGCLSDGFDGVVIPKDITAGDTITIEYTGELIKEEIIYPSNICLFDGEVISYSFSYTNVVPMFTECLTEEMLLEYDAPNNYVILDRNGRYTTIDKYEGETVYLVEDQRTVRQRTEDQPFYVACMLAYNPRDLEDGVPQYENISESEAMKIAHDHYYNTYYINYEVEFEYETSLPESLEGYWKVCIFEHWEGKEFYYTIDKITGEIASIEIAE